MHEEIEKTAAHTAVSSPWRSTSFTSGSVFSTGDSPAAENCFDPKTPLMDTDTKFGKRRRALLKGNLPRLSLFIRARESSNVMEWDRVLQGVGALDGYAKVESTVAERGQGTCPGKGV